MSIQIGRYGQLNDELEIQELQQGMDFRLPKYRRAVFMKFYAFHLRYKSHPGCVYYLMPHLAETYGWNTEQKLWFAFLNGCTQNPCTSLLIFNEFPELYQDPLELEQFTKWFNNHWARLPFDTDRRYQKRDMPNAIANYVRLMKDAGSQQELFEGKSFMDLWTMVRKNFYSFGRLASFSYLEYVHIMGFGKECSTLFLSDLSGSKSHRNGLCKVLGRDDLDWHKSNPIVPIYDKETLQWLNHEGHRLLSDAIVAFRHESFYKDIGFFTLESCLCTWKSWHRPNRRYPSVYNDMLYLRIQQAQELWPTQDWTIFWQARAKALPRYLRWESNPKDPGLCKEKQNWFREKGCPVMMSQDEPCFDNEFDRRIFTFEE